MASGRAGIDTPNDGYPILAVSVYIILSWPPLNVFQIVSYIFQRISWRRSPLSVLAQVAAGRAGPAPRPPAGLVHPAAPGGL